MSDTYTAGSSNRPRMGTVHLLSLRAGGWATKREARVEQEAQDDTRRRRAQRRRDLDVIGANHGVKMRTFLGEGMRSSRGGST